MPSALSIDASDPDYAPFASRPALIGALGFGVFDDSFLCDGGNAEKWRLFANAGSHCNGGEVSYYTVNDQKHALSQSGPHGVSLAVAVRTRSLTYLVGNDQPGFRTPAEIAAAGRTMGYRLKITDARSGESVTRVSLRNAGTGVVPFDVYPATSGVSSTESLKGMVPGQTRICTIAAPFGGSLTLVSPRLLIGQVIPFDGN